jgi:hypothetical protein
VVGSAHPAWDLADREADAQRLEHGELVLPEGHATMGTTELDAASDSVLEMPRDSLWPLALALCLALLFAGLVAEIHVLSIVGGVLGIAALAGWHIPREEAAT